MNNIICKEQKIWRKDFENGPAYSVSFSTKLQDGKFVNSYMSVRFAKSAEAPEIIHNGTVADFSGFITSTSKGQPMIMVTSLNIKDDDLSEADSFSAAEDDIPFN